MILPDDSLLNWDMPQLSRSAALTGFADLARSLGLDPRRLAEGAGVPVAALTDPDLKIPAASVGRLLTRAAERAGIDDFGIRLAETRRLSNMGAVALIAREQPSLRKALEVMAQYQWLQSEGLSLLLEENGVLAIASLHFAGHRTADLRQPTELSLGVLCRNIRTIKGESWNPEAVLFRHAKPKRGDAHLRVFGVTPEFGADMDALVLKASELDAPLASADPELARLAVRYVDLVAGRPERTMREKAGELIVLLLPTGTCTADRVALHLGIDRRTLHRRLAAEGTNFSGLADEKRSEVVLYYIADARRSLTAIADLAGFSDASAFSHWFRRHYATAPREFRRKRGTASQRQRNPVV